MSTGNIIAGWRKSGIYFLNSEEPLSSPFMKEQIAKEQPLATESPPKQPTITRGDAVELGEREARTTIRELAKQVKDLEARNALLITQLAHANEKIETLSKSKKRKKVKVDSNEKLASFKAVIGTQEAQDLKAIEEGKRAARRAKKAKK